MELKINYLWWIEDKEQWTSLTWSSTLFELIDNNWKEIYRLLVDAWAFQWSKNVEQQNQKEVIWDLNSLNGIIVTHAHLDHIWRIPYLVKMWYSWSIYMSKTTFELAKLNWFDSLKINNEDEKKWKHFRKKLRDFKTIINLERKNKTKGIKKHIKEKIRKQLELLLEKHKITLEEVKNILNKQDIRNNQDISEIKKKIGLFEEEDIYKTIQQIIIVNKKKDIKLHQFVNFKFYNSAHIEWSTLPFITFKNEVGNTYKCLIAQDLWRFKDNPIEEIPNIPHNTDYIQLETTYAWRNHPKLEESKQKLINEILEHTWPILIPAFAIQRTQFILKILIENLDILWDRKIYVTSKFAEQVKDIFLSKKFEKYKYLLNKNIRILDQQSNLNKTNLKKAIIIWSSWMLEWGSIEKWAKELIPNSTTKIIFTWYQWEWTKWRQVLDQNSYIVIKWKAIPVKCKSTIISWFSSHADTNDLLHLLRNFKKYNWNKILLTLTHGGDNRYLFEKIIKNSRKIRRIYKPKVVKLFQEIKIDLSNNSKKWISYQNNFQDNQKSSLKSIIQK